MLWYPKFHPNLSDREHLEEAARGSYAQNQKLYLDSDYSS